MKLQFSVVLLRWWWLPLLAVLLFANSVYSQTKGRNFRHITPRDGLSGGFIWKIIQDRHGFIWVASSGGLDRYDGNLIRNFIHIPGDSTSIAAGYVRFVFEHPDGNIWAGTSTGISVLNPATGIFRQVLLQDTLPSVKTPESFVVYENGEVWIGASQGVYHFPAQQLETGYFVANFIDLKEEGTVWAMTSDNTQAIWFTTNKNVYKLNPGTFKPERISLSDEVRQAVESTFSNMYFDSKGNLWLATGANLYEWGSNDESFRLTRTFRNTDIETRTAGFQSFYEDKAARLWIGTPGYGAIMIDLNSDQAQVFKHEPNIRNGLAEIQVNCVLVDRDGGIWFGHFFSGITYMSEGIWDYSFSRILEDRRLQYMGNNTNSIKMDRQGNAWIATGLGLVKTSFNNQPPKVFMPFPELIQTAERFKNSFRDISIAESDIYILDFYNQLIKFDKSSETFVRIELPDKEAEINSICGNETFLFAGTNQSGLIVLDKRNTEPVLYPNPLNSPGNTAKWKMLPLIDKAGNIIVQAFPPDELQTSTEWNLYFFKPETKMFVNTGLDSPEQMVALNTPVVSSTTEGVLWSFHNQGILRQDIFRKENKLIFSQEISTQIIKGTRRIVEDLDGNLWMGEVLGVYRLHPETETYTFFEADPDRKPLAFNNPVLLESGEIVFGGVGGYTRFDPRAHPVETFAPALYLTSLNAGTRKSDLLYSVKESVELSHDQNNITIEFITLDFRNPPLTRYRYRMKGQTDEWIEIGNQRQMTFANLMPGDYRFEVQAAVNKQSYSGASAMLNIHISSPWWYTYWAYALYAIIIFSLLYLLRRYELNRQLLKFNLHLKNLEAIRLTELDLFKNRLYTNLTHEFRTPLTLILGQVESVMSAPIDPKERRKLEVANRNAGRLLTLINELLDLAKLEVGSMELTAQKQNIVSFLKSLFFSFESLAEEKNIHLSFFSEEDLIYVVFDSGKMEKIFYNLMSNALKFTPGNGQINVSITLEEKNMVAIRVKDTGFGIPEDKLEKVFDQFYQLDNSSTRQQEGTGIGLALAKELVLLHQGKISVVSHPGQGSEFIVLLPATQDDSDLSIETEIKHKFPVPEPISTGFETDKNNTEFSSGSISDTDSREIILIVEDNVDVRAYIREQVEQDYQILEARDGEEGIHVAQAAVPDLIITDVMMPAMDGYQFCTAIRLDEKTSHIPVIMLTAKGGLESKIEGLEKGVDAYLTKPFSARELKATVKNLIQQRLQLRKQFSTSLIIRPSEVTSLSLDQEFLSKVVQTIELNFQDESFSVEILAAQVSMSSTQLNRKLNALIDQPPGQLIRSFRLQRAADLLRQQAGTVSEIGYKVGFSDHTYFSRAFKKQFGCSPSEYAGTSEEFK